MITNPYEVNLAVLLVPFAILWILLYQMFRSVLSLLYKNSLHQYKIKIVSLIGSLLIVNFALLSSVGQLTLQDGVIVLLITVIGGFYLYKFQIR